MLLNKELNNNHVISSRIYKFSKVQLRSSKDFLIEQNNLTAYMEEWMSHEKQENYENKKLRWG